MRLDAHYGMLPERAFEKRGFGHTRPATLEGGGKGGGGGGPTQSTVYNTNIPEYAKPYVTSMLGATARQLFTGTENETGGYDITGFRPYQPYSTDPTKYFAGPSSLQQQTYQEAAGMQTPGQFGGASQLASAAGVQALGTQGQAGMLGSQALGYGQAGQMYGGLGARQAIRGAEEAARQADLFGGMGAGIGMQGADIGRLGMQAAAPAFQAGQTYMQGVTDPSRVGQFMSPYQQQVTDIAKAAAVRDAQMLEQGNRLAAARQGTYGGARQALASLERERNLATNLANIQAQGSQQAYDRALQQMQFGSNLGLQGIQTGLQGVQQGLAGTGQAMQGAGMGLQGVGQRLAAGQLGLQGTAQGIQGAQAGLQGVGQATQAGQLGLQGAQAATQAAGTLGQLGSQQQQADLARIGLQNQLGQAQQQYQQNIINQAVQDYATAQQYPLMQLGFMSNMLRGLPLQATSTQSYMAQPSTTQQLLGLAGTGASLYGAFGRKEGGTVKSYAAGGGIRASLENRIDDIAEAGGISGLKKLMTETQSPEAKRIIAEKIREMGIAAAPTGDLGRNMAGGGIVAFANGDLVEDPMMQFSGFTPEAMAADELRLAEIKRKKDIEKYNFLKEASPIAAKRMLERDPSLEAKPVVAAAPAAAPAADTGATRPPAAPAAPTSAAGEYSSPTGLAAVLAERKKLLGFEGEGEKSKALMKALEERAGRLGKEAESDRYLRAAQAFAQFGSTAGPIGKAALGAVGEFAKGEAGARKEQEKMNLEVTKMQADLEKAQRAEARGDLDAAEKFYNSAKDRENRLSVASASANKQVELVERAMNDPKFMDALRMSKGIGESTQVQQDKAALDFIKNRLTFLDPKKDAKEIADLQQKQQAILRRLMGGEIPGSSGGGSGKVDTNNPLLK